MTTTTIALSRQIATLPAAPTCDRRPDEPVTSRGGAIYYRDAAGMLWIDAAPGGEDDVDWLLDLSDAATGGAMLARVTVDTKVTTRLDPPSVSIVYVTRNGNESWPRYSGTRWEPTMAVAVARVVAERGRW